MKQTVQNLARRPLAIHCNSGETLHLPPGYMHEIPEEELKGNALVEKLMRRKLISVKITKNIGAKKIASPGPKVSSKKVAKSSPKAKSAKASSKAMKV